MTGELPVLDGAATMPGMNGPQGAAGPARTVRQFVYGDAPLDEWVAQGDGDPGEPWDSFARARQLAHSGQQQEAVKIWRQIAATEGLESRQVLQAWHFLREAGEQPPADRAKLVLGAVAEMPVSGGHDLLAAYRDGTARYLNYSGKAVVWEDRSVAPIQSAINDWLAKAQVIVNAIGPWNQPALPPLPPGHARLMMLTPSGPHFGQGPVADLSADQAARSFITAATGLMQLVVGRAMA
jgi:hypothetical protein